MAQYIDKDALLTEIERRMKLRRNGYEKYKSVSDFIAWEELEYFKEEFLPTLEVKEVDLEKEFDNYAKNILACDVLFEPFTHLYNCAKYFYELGINARKEAE